METRGAARRRSLASADNSSRSNDDDEGHKEAAASPTARRRGRRSSSTATTEKEEKEQDGEYRPTVHSGWYRWVDAVVAFAEDPLWVVQVSRPAFWVILVWLYMFPHQQAYPWTRWQFWVGIGYVAFPLNFLVYAWNDLMDCEMDLRNPRKGSWIYGARGSYQRYLRIFPLVWLINVPYMAVLVYINGSAWQLAVVVLFVVTNGLYNLPAPYGLRTIPFLDLVAQCAYVLVILFSALVNEVSFPPWPAFVFNVLFAMHAQLGGELMDLAVDRATGRRTTATAIGGFSTKILMLAIVGGEIYVLGKYFAEWYMAAMLASVAVFIVVDMLLVSRGGPWTETQIKIFGAFIAFYCPFTVVYVWSTGCLSWNRMMETVSNY